MKKISSAVAFVTAMLAGTAAHAAVIVTSVAGSTLAPGFLGGPTGSTYITFEDVLAGTTGAFSSNGFSFSGDGAVQNTSVGGQYAAPAGDTSLYLTTGFDGTQGLKTETLITGSFNRFGIYWGSIDQYNTITFKLGAATVATFGGCDIAPSVCNGDQGSDTTNRYVNFNFGTDTFDSVVFTSTSPAFEVDNIALANAVPELSTWGMMLLGFAGIGFMAYRRSKRTALTAA